MSLFEWLAFSFVYREEIFDEDLREDAVRFHGCLREFGDGFGQRRRMEVIVRRHDQRRLPQLVSVHEGALHSA